MTYQELLAKMSQLKFGNILVTGPQRSGTTIAAHALAQDLGMEYFDEDDIGWERKGFNNETVLRQLLATNSGYVIQAPACAHICHTLPQDTVVVFMMRPLSDITVSEGRIAWGCEGDELVKYPPEYRATPIAETKYAYWEDIQRGAIAHAYELDYDSLRGHPLWVEKNGRKEFAARQWRE